MQQGSITVSERLRKVTTKWIISGISHKAPPHFDCGQQWGTRDLRRCARARARGSARARQTLNQGARPDVEASYSENPHEHFSGRSTPCATATGAEPATRTAYHALGRSTPCATATGADS